ncbi:ABC transporter ATP-binding protein [Pseudothermotoga elfii]
MKKLFELKSVSKDFGKLRVLKNINLTFYEGESIAIVGKSGCGKTTLLRIIASLDMPSSGEIKKSTNKIGYVFQEDRLIPWYTVLDNLFFVCNEKKTALSALKLVGLESFHNYRPAKLSGGMKQRVNFARAISIKPELLLLDEPFQSLDLLTKTKLIEDFSNIIKKLNISTVLVTHDVREAVSIAEKIYVLAGQPATIVDEIKIEQSQKGMFNPGFIEIEKKILKLQSS